MLLTQLEMVMFGWNWISSLDNKATKERAVNRAIDEALLVWGRWGLLLTSIVLVGAAFALIKSQNWHWFSTGLLGFNALVLSAGIFFSYRFHYFHGRAPKKWRGQFLALDLIQSVGLAVFLSVSTRGLNSELYVLVLFSVASYSLINIAPLAPFDRYLKLKQVLVWSPFLIASLASFPASLVTALSIAVFLCTIIVISERAGQYFWQKEEANFLVRLKTMVSVDSEQQQREDNLLKGHLLHNIGQDFHVNLSDVQQSIALLRETTLTLEQKRILKDVATHCSKQQLLIDSVLDYSKLLAKKLTFNKSANTMRRNLEIQLNRLAQEADERGVVLNYGFVLPFPERLVVDSERVSQALTLLLDSMIRYSASGDVFVEFEYSAKDEKSGIVKIHLKDILHELQTSHRRVVADAFHESSTAETSLALRLSLSRGIANAMGGKLAFRREANGDLFTFEIPVEQRLGAGVQFMPNSKLQDVNFYIFRAPAITEHHIEAQLKEWLLNAESVSDENTLRHLIDTNIAAKNDSGNLYHPQKTSVLFFAQPTDDTIWALAASIANDYEIPVFIAASNSVVSQFVSREYLVQNRRVTVVNNPLEWDVLHQLLVRQVLNIDVTPARLLSSASENDSSSVKGKVLIVEDSQVNQMLAEKMVNKLGYETFLAKNGIEALSLLEKNSFDLILMDCQMAEMDGYTATEKIRIKEKTAGEKQHIPIIALTANISESDQSRCMAVGMDDYLSKPVKLNELEFSLRRWLGDSQQLQRH